MQIKFSVINQYWALKICCLNYLRTLLWSARGTIMQDQVLNFIYDAYYDKTEVLVVPESLRMKKDVSNRRETSELKAYRTKNRYEMLISNIKLFVAKRLRGFLYMQRHFISRQDCSHILDWIRRTQGWNNEVLYIFNRLNQAHLDLTVSKRKHFFSLLARLVFKARALLKHIFILTSFDQKPSSIHLLGSDSWAAIEAT